MIFPGVPRKFTGYYTYNPSRTVTNKDNAILTGVTDECDIYAVYFRTDANTPYLTGDNILTHPNIVAVAKATTNDELAPTTEVKQFSFDFNYSYNPVTPAIDLPTPNTIDPVALENMEYSMAVVFTSSKRGGEFIGAVGSTLIIDGVEIICE